MYAFLFFPPWKVDTVITASSFFIWPTQFGIPYTKYLNTFRTLTMKHHSRNSVNEAHTATQTFCSVDEYSEIRRARNLETCLHSKKGLLQSSRSICCVYLKRTARRKSTAERLQGSWVRISPGAWMFVSCTVFVLSGREVSATGPSPRPEESYRLWCVSDCDQVKMNNLDTYCE
jgi:hypothetical protein